MDPNANLAEQLRLVTAIVDAPDHDLEAIALAGERLADLVEALNSWIAAGGALPAAWSHYWQPKERT